MPNINSKEITAKPILTWDLPLRIFHWSMVVTVIIAAVTGYFLEGWALYFHVYAGYGIGCLLSFRLIWGFIGSYYSRFNSYPLGIKDVISHSKNIISGKHNIHRGHNPIGAWMIILLLSCLILLILTGMIVLAGQENQGPFANSIGYKLGEFNEDIHEIIANILIFAIAIHISGVLVENFAFNNPIIRAMITGRKITSDIKETVTIWHAIYGVLILALITAGAVYLEKTASLTAKTAFQAMPEYEQECGSCHPAYHPSLRTAESWQSIINSLSDHYGEDASIIDYSMKKITIYLQNNNAQSFDTKLSHKIGRHNTNSMRMTDTKYWQKKHKKIEDNNFKHSAIGSKVNCNGCHKDANTGRYDDENIKLPKGIK